MQVCDDTYLIVPCVNVDSRCAELVNVEDWSQANKLVLNHSKSLEIMFADRRRKRSFNPPSLIPAIRRATVIKILGASIINNLSVTDILLVMLIRNVQALRIQRSHEMSTDCIYTIHRSVVVAILT